MLKTLIKKLIQIVSQIRELVTLWYYCFNSDQTQNASKYTGTQ